MPTHGLARIALWTLSIAFICENRLLAQQPSNSAGTVANSLQIAGLSRAQHSRPQAGNMLALNVHVRNSGQQLATAELVGRIKGQPGEEDRRKIEVLPGKSDIYELDLRVLPSNRQKKIEAVVTLNAIENGREVLLTRGDAPVSQSVVMDLVSDSSRTAIALDADPPEQLFWRWPRTPTYASYELVLASRIDAGLSRVCVTLDGLPLPIHLSDWQGIDVIVIGNPEVLKDSSSIGALQQFMHHGGRIWVILDKVDTSLIEPLLERNQQCQTLDVVETNHFEITIPGSIDFSAEARTIDSDKPVKLKRVVQHGGRVTHAVDGWPAAIAWPVSQGELFVTALESHGWLTPRETLTSVDSDHSSKFSLPVWGNPLALKVHEPKHDTRLVDDELQYPLAHIGNPTVPRSLVSTILAAFCAVLVLIGVWRWLAGELRWMGILAPTLALIASVPLIMVAVVQRREMFDMVSMLQILTYSSQGCGVLNEKAAVYASSSRKMELHGNADGFALPSPTIESGIRSLTTADFEKWSLSNDAWPTGTWRYSTEMALDSGNFTARGVLSNQGLTVELPSHFKFPLEDAIIGYAPGTPSIGKAMQGNRSWQIDGSLPAGGDRWTGESFLSEEQLRRAAIYQDIFNVRNPRRPPTRSLFGWTDIQGQGATWDVDLVRRGSALVSLPIELVTPEVGTDVFIPYPLIRIEQSATSSNSMYNASRAKWIEESSLDTQAIVAFSLPPEVVPLAASKIDIEWDIKAPQRRAQLYWTKGGQRIDIVNLNEPSLPWRGTIENAEVLNDLSDGWLELHVDVTNHQAKDLQSQNRFVSWRLKHLKLSVAGRTLPRSNIATLPQLGRGD